MKEKSDSQKIIHQIPPVWDSESRVLILGTMPSPKSREAGFFYMHPQNRFWKVLPAVFGEELAYPNNLPDRDAAISERRGNNVWLIVLIIFYRKIILKLISAVFLDDLFTYLINYGIILQNYNICRNKALRCIDITETHLLGSFTVRILDIH